MERETGVEPATSTLARSRSTTELLPLVFSFYSTCHFADNSLHPHVTPARLVRHDSQLRDVLFLSLACLRAEGDYPLLGKAPQTSGMTGGSVKLKPGESVGWHSTSANEEALVILHGSGVANIEGHPMCHSPKGCSPTSRPRHGTTSQTAGRKSLSTSGWSRRQPRVQRSKCAGRP